MKNKFLIMMLTMTSLNTAHAQYWPADTECSPGDVDCLHTEDHSYVARSASDGYFYEVCVGGNWAGPVCFKTGIITRVSLSDEHRLP